MLMSLLSHLLCAWFVYFLPSYATFKALAGRPTKEAEFHRWAVYWSVTGIFIALEHAVERFISWLPFYWELKTIFLLYLSLPQTQGSTYIYDTYLQPFYTKYEADLDEGIVQVQKNILNFVQTRLQALWEFILNAANKRQGATVSGHSSATNGAAGSAPSPLQAAIGFVQSYGGPKLNVIGAQTKGASTSVQNSPAVPAQRRPSNSPAKSNPSTPVGTPAADAPSFPQPYHF